MLAALTCSGCFGLFDPTLYMGRDDAGIAPDAGPGLQGELAEICGDEAPLLHFPPGAQSFEFDVDTIGREDNTRDVTRCTGRAAGGPDVFMAIDATEGEHWHFHVDVDPFEGRASANPAIYVLRGCDERACSDGDGLDLCGEGSDEHFTFIPRASGRHVVGFDSPDGVGFEGRILAFRTICGDGVKDHSENCDDGNTDDGDGCDAMCRSELSGARPSEIEVNDDLYAANRLLVGAGETTTVRGSVDSLCEVDVFAVDVPEGGAILASLTGAGGAACDASLEGTSLELLEVGAAGADVRLTAQVPDGAVCPAIDADDALARGLSAGTYFLRATKLQDRPDSVPYELSVTIEPGG